MHDPPDVRATFDAGFVFAFIHLPEPFKSFAVRKSVSVLQVDSGC